MFWIIDASDILQCHNIPTQHADSAQSAVGCNVVTIVAIKENEKQIMKTDET